MTMPSKPELLDRALTEARLACLPLIPEPGAPYASRFEPCRHLAVFLLCCLRLVGEPDYVYLATTCQLFGPQGGRDRDPQVGSYDFPVVGSRFIRPGVATFLVALRMFGHASEADVDAALDDVGASEIERDEAGRTVSRMLASAVMES